MSMTSSPSSQGEPSHSETGQWRFVPLGLSGVFLIEPPRFDDTRGWFSETYHAQAFARHGIELSFVQDNTSYSLAAGTVRGLHYQSPPFAQAKLVRVVKGRILDVAVDIRAGSPTYGKHVTVELSDENGRQLLVPVGFAHGFVTREPETVVAYKVTSHYAPDHDHGIFWADPDLGIAWGIDAADAILSPKDLNWPRLAEARPAFAM
jgi:dTDP-4-dehydrorhamnose 3,5-epimerase